MIILHYLTKIEELPSWNTHKCPWAAKTSQVHSLLKGNVLDAYFDSFIQLGAYTPLINSFKNRIWPKKSHLEKPVDSFSCNSSLVILHVARTDDLFLELLEKFQLGYSL